MKLLDSLLRINPHRFLKQTGATIVELMFVLAILGLGISALLQTIGAGVNYALDTENNIKAINVAREGIEAVMNIRDTNWLRFSSDKTNCWNVLDYSAGCIGNTTTIGKIGTGSFTIITRNGAWYLSGAATINPLTNWSNYKSQYSVGLSSDGFYTQTGIVMTPCSSFLQNSCQTIFTREIYISNPKTGVMMVQSTARWFQERPREVTIHTILTNWKSNF